MFVCVANKIREEITRSQATHEFEMYLNYAFRMQLSLALPCLK